MKEFICPCKRKFKKFSKYFSHCSKEHPEIEFVMEKPAEYIRHIDHDNGTVGLFGPMPPNADLNDAASDLWAQSGEIQVMTADEVATEFGTNPGPHINSWFDWLAQAEE